MVEAVGEVWSGSIGAKKATASSSEGNLGGWAVGLMIGPHIEMASKLESIKVILGGSLESKSMREWKV